MTAALWTSEDAATATGGRSTKPWQATGVSIDTRTLVPGDLFVAVTGDRFDGHDFVADALAKGAAAALVSRQPPHVAEDVSLLFVANTLKGLEALAIAARARTKAPVVGITGSVGKTGTKEALALALGSAGETMVSAGNLNNQIGLPLSLARLPVRARFGVLEMGMNHSGEISFLTRIARPNVAIVTTIEAVHLEYFASTEGIAEAKAEIFEGVTADGAAVLNRDNPFFALLADRARTNGVGRIVSFGNDMGADVRLVSLEASDDGSDVVADVAGTSVRYRLNVPGRHWVQNSLGVLGVVHALGVAVEPAAAAMAGLVPPKGRGARTTIAIGDGTVVVIDDSYNASPVSMAASFEILANTRPGPGGRRIAVVGDMLELGPKSAQLHRELAGVLEGLHIDRVFAAGPMMAHLYDALPSAMRADHAPDSTRLAPKVADAIRPGDVVVVKGSAGSRMGVVVRALTERGASAADGKGN